jgi:hypothetical protein
VRTGFCAEAPDIATLQPASCQTTQSEAAMICPKCDAEMNVRSLRTLQGLVEFDQCPSCKGFWFDT